MGNNFRLIVFESSVPVQHATYYSPIAWRALTNGYHTLGVIIQILQHHLAEGIHFASPAYSKSTRAIVRYSICIRSLIIPSADFFLTQESTLLFQPPQQTPQFPHHLAIARPVALIFSNHNGKVENKLISAVFAFANAHRISNDAVVVDAKGE